MSPPLRELVSAPPGFSRAIGTCGGWVGVDQSRELAAHTGEFGDLVVDLGESSAQEAVGVSTRALTAIHDLEQVGDVIES
jgi:hypothetical protein